MPDLFWIMVIPSLVATVGMHVSFRPVSASTIVNTSMLKLFGVYILFYLGAVVFAPILLSPILGGASGFVWIFLIAFGVPGCGVGFLLDLGITQLWAKANS